MGAPSNKPGTVRKGSSDSRNAEGTRNRRLGIGVNSIAYRNGRLGATEGFVDYIRARGEVRHALVISDPLPVDSVQNMWATAGQAATIGIFLILFGAFLYIGHAILL